ncbi:hypothetical protein NDI54_20030 [Haloarcula sp. S1AR25-5A]|uniref:Uncharacterized protein n=1 Tax=Haloarcula terrestris TaxID=2950533 RepID=A0AAE4F1X9_9EURY|nr:hypothetical protein [Haloarcula terrestris]MDS0223634.1 hypothetical protein [Haloarcula terrestris]
MQFDTSSEIDYAPPNDPWQSHDPSEYADSYLTLYYSEDEISKYPVREVTRVNDNKSDPNLETMSYGLCSTCTRGIRSGLVKNSRPYLFFCTQYNGERHLAGYYHIGWYSKGKPLFTNYSNGAIQDDYRLVADEMKWLYPPIKFETIADQTDVDEIQSGFRKKLISAEQTDELLRLFRDREDYSEEYINEIRRLERINRRYHEFRYPTWERNQLFDWESVQEYVRMSAAQGDEEIKATIEQKVDDLNVDLDLASSEDTSNWYCLVCDHEFQNEAPLKLCPKCNNGGGIISSEAINP